MILVLIESSGKIEKIQHILGKDYKVLASLGHIIDLDKKDISIDFDNNYEPKYKILDGKHDVIKKICAMYNKCDDVLIATDKDREGEMIAWSLARELHIKNPKRITFTSITQKDLIDAVKHAGKINIDLVNAQKLRRILDRIIGYRISPLLSKSLGRMASSAGRVQSVVVRLIVEKENEIENFFESDEESFFKTMGEFSIKNHIMKSQLYSINSHSKSTDNSDDEYSDDESTEDSSSESSEDESDSSSEDDSSNDESSEEESEDDIENKPKKGKISKINKLSDARNVMLNISKSTFKISNISEKESIRYPSAPFTTSTLQQEASRKMGFSSKQTMIAAQHLYEAGFITYMRTDSVSLSDEAMDEIKKFVTKTYGKEYYRKMDYNTKSKKTKTVKTQEAHEAIRPTHVEKEFIAKNSTTRIDDTEIKLYNLIWKRSIASQMAGAKFNVITIQIDISKLTEYYFVSIVENNTFMGFLEVYKMKNVEHDNDEESEDDIINDFVPKIGTKLVAKNIICSQDYKRPPCRYNEASLINKMDPKNLNIGRPSTYSKIIDKIQESKYIKKEDNEGIEKKSIILKWNGNKITEENKKIILGKDTNKFIPTELGKEVNKFLMKYFPDIMDYKFTAHMEDQLDLVASGDLNWVKIFDDFYKSFQPLVEKLNSTIKPKQLIDENERCLGNHPDTGNKIIATIGPYGVYAKMYLDDEHKKSVCAPIKKPLTLKKVTLEDVVKLFEYPKKLGMYGKKEVNLMKGQYGFYLKLGKGDNVGLNGLTEEDIDGYTLEDAIEKIEEKNKKILWEGKDEKYKYIILDGQYGKYISAKPIKGKKVKAKNCKLADDINITELTIDKVSNIVANTKISKRKFVKKN